MDDNVKKEYCPLTIPKLAWNKKVLSDTFGELVAQPLESGFGTTMGNALRRVLLGGVEGSAVTSVIIKGVNNEFSTIPGVEEDTMQVVLNIKGLVIRSANGNPGTMSLKLSGEGAARGSDIVTDEHLEIVNPDHVIANIAADGELEIQFFVESGRGYQPAQWPAGEALQEDDRIFIDAMFSPIRKVMFDVEKTRVGKNIDYDKLILRVTTDGSETPTDALHYAVSVLRTQLEQFLSVEEIPFNDISSSADLVVEVENEESIGEALRGLSPELLMKPIEELELSVRAHNCLINAGIKRLLDLVNLNEDAGLKIKNFGRKSLNEVKDSMEAFGLSFGMNIKERDVKKALQEKGE